MEIKEIRLANLLEQVEIHGRANAFCDIISMNPSYLSQLKGGTKSVGNNLARRIEEKLGLAKGYLDEPKEIEPLVQQGPEPPHLDSLAIAYTIDTFPSDLRDSLKQLVFNMHLNCKTKDTTATTDSTT